METEVLKFDSAQSFLNSLQGEDNKPAEEKVQEAPFQELINQKNKPTSTETSEETVDDGKKKDVQEELNKITPKEEAAPSLISDVAKFSEKLKEKELLQPYEDGTFPQTEDEVLDALIQTNEFKVNSTIEQAWKQKVENLPESLQIIHQYAQMGVQTAKELAPFIQQVSQLEAIAQLDPKNAEHQEQIVLIQLLNTNMNEKSAKEEVADLKERGKLEARANQYFPSLKKSYEDNVRQSLLEKQQKEEQFEQYIDTNATNVTYFLEKDLDYLPFKIDKDRALKAKVFDLAGIPVDRTSDGDPVFGWQKQIESLQYGDEKSYKKFMKLMTFLADDEKYDKNVGKKVESSAHSNTFKKIATTQIKATNNLSQEKEHQTTAKKIDSKAAWSIS